MRSFDAKDAAGPVPTVPQEELDRLSENVIGAFPLPLSVVKMTINGQERIVPLVTEEAGVVAGIAKAAKLVGPRGFVAQVESPGDIRAHALVTGIPEIETLDLAALRAELEGAVRAAGDPFRKYGGGLLVLTVERHRKFSDDAVLIELMIGTGDAMGAKVGTRMAERAGRLFIERCGGRLVGAIITNQDCGHSVYIAATWPVDAERAAHIVELHRWATTCPDRAVTHNKGVMNGVIAFAQATGQDTRAIEASAGGLVRDRPLTRFTNGAEGVTAKASLQLAVATVGGATQHTVAVACRKIAGVSDAGDLAVVMAAVGLAANFASLLQLSSPEGFSATYERLKR